MYYTIRDLGALPGTGGGHDSGTYAESLNNHGEVVGMSHVGPGPTGFGEFHAFRWTASNGMQDLGRPGESSDATDVSEYGVISGTRIPFGAPTRGFRWWNSAVGPQILDTDHGYGINAFGQISGDEAGAATRSDWGGSPSL